MKAKLMFTVTKLNGSYPGELYTTRFSEAASKASETQVDQSLGKNSQSGFPGLPLPSGSVKTTRMNKTFQQVVEPMNHAQARLQLGELTTRLDANRERLTIQVYQQIETALAALAPASFARQMLDALKAVYVNPLSLALYNSKNDGADRRTRNRWLAVIGGALNGGPMDGGASAVEQATKPTERVEML
ncbi:MAG: hypothetical protein EOP39_29005 [Rubrivivax sp.]|nr:MAG: hypothetical protein EOP39_29005 [Rubrivivax sp.]